MYEITVKTDVTVTVPAGKEYSNTQRNLRVERTSGITSLGLPTKRLRVGQSINSR